MLLGGDQQVGRDGAEPHREQLLVRLVVLPGGEEGGEEGVEVARAHRYRRLGAS